MKLVNKILVLSLLLQLCDCESQNFANIFNISNVIDIPKVIDIPNNIFNIFNKTKDINLTNIIEIPQIIDFPNILNFTNIIDIPNVINISNIFDIPHIKDIPNILGKPLLTPVDVIINLFKQTVLGGPFLLGGTLITAACELLLRSGIMETRILPDIKNINLQLRNFDCSNVTVPVLKAEQLLNEPQFDVELKTVILISGWRHAHGMSDILDILSQPYRCRNDTNILVLDAASFVDTFYAWAALNTEQIGEYVAVGLQRLSSVYNIDKIHLIGYSLGAQIASAVGRSYERMTGHKLKRITGLDPANPCFYDAEKLPGLQRSDAVFVDVIHTNSGVLGTAATVGTVDIFVGKPSDTLQVGCFDIVCSHARSVAYYAESIYENNWHNFPIEACEIGNVDYLGYILHTNHAQSICTLNVNAAEPFGKNATSEFTAAKSDCGKCVLNFVI